MVHEWGTFTSLQGSNGAVQPGMHYEEESLPAFVYGRVPPMPGSNAQKSAEGEVVRQGITQKLETPVIYFYGAPSHVDVRVDFPRGVISQWYPQATSYAPEVYQAQFDPNDVMNGSMTWSLDVLDVGETDGIIAVPPEDVWAPSRNVDAQPVRFGDEVEKFVFYRGLGRFETPFRVTSTGETLHLHNDSPDLVPDVFVLHWNGERGAVWPLGEVEGHGRVDFVPAPKELPQPEYLDTARKLLAAALVRSGLTEDESWAMVDTWNRSYFKTPGLRVLYVVPRPWTDELLPIEVTPAPDELVRTMVGRIEVMTDADERDLLARIEAAASGTGAWMSPEEVGRFAEPRLQRIRELARDPVVIGTIDGLIAQVRSTPAP